MSHELLKHSHENLKERVVRLAAMSLVLAVGAVSLFTMEDTPGAWAAALGYPDAAMPCEHYPYAQTGPGADYDWGPTHTAVYGDSSEISSRGYAYRNCTDYVAWKESALGVTIPRNLGNAGNWYYNAPVSDRSGIPKPGEAAVEPGSASSFGHVAFVESVNGDGTITVSEYNYDLRGDGDIRTGTSSSLGFTEFVDFGASVSAKAAAAQSDPTPAIAYNPGNDLPVVAEQDPQDELTFHYQKSDASWGTSHLGEADSAPDVAYNPGNDRPVIAAEGAGRTLMYYYQKSDASWGAAHLGEADSAPDVTYDLSDNLPGVAVEGAGHDLLYYYQRPGGSWSHDYLGETGSAPALAYNPANGSPAVVNEGVDGTLDYHYMKADGAWGLAHLGDAGSRPEVAYNPGNDLPVVVAQGSDGTLDYHYQHTDGSWGSVQLGHADSDPSAAYNPFNGRPVVAVKDGSQLIYHYQQSDAGWGSIDLGPGVSAPDVAYNPSNGRPVVAAEGSDGFLEYYYQKSDAGWGLAGL